MLFQMLKIYPIFFVICIMLQKKVYITKRQFVILWVLFVLALSVIAYSLNPPVDWDIGRQSVYMSQLRSSGISFWKFLFKNEEFVGGYEYYSMFTFNVLRYFAVHVSENNYLISVICVVIDYSILGYIAIDWWQHNGKKSSVNLFVLLLNFTFMPYIYVYSGIRNALCASIMGLSVYLYLYKRKTILALIILSFLSATIHPVGMLVIPFVFLSKPSFDKASYVAVFILPTLLRFIARISIQLRIPYFSMVGRKYIEYISESQYRGSRAPLYGVLILISIFLFIYFCSYRQFDEKEKPQNLIYNFIALYMTYILGNIGNYDMVLRPAYVLGILAPILSCFLSDERMWSCITTNGRIKKIISLSSSGAVLIVCLYVQYKFYEEFGSYLQL